MNKFKINELSRKTPSRMGRVDTPKMLGFCFQVLMISITLLLHWHDLGTLLYSGY